MAEYDGDIKLHVDLGEKNILQSLNDIKKKVGDAFSGKEADELDKHISNTNKNLQQTQKEFQKIQSEISKTAGKLKELEARYNAIEQTGTRAATGSQKYKYNGLFYNKTDAVRLAELRARLENMYSTLDGLRERSSELNNNLLKLEIGDDTTQQMNDLGRATSDTTREASGLRSAFSRVLTTIKRFGKTVISIFKKLSLNVAKLARDITVKLGNAIIAPVKSIGNTVTSLFRRMFMSIRRVFVFSMLTSAFRGLREDIGNLISADTQLAASLKQIQSNLWTAFAPIYSAALPALRSLMGVLSQATGYVAAFFSALTGNTVSQSYSQAQNLKSSATSDDAKKKALDVEIKDINKKIKALNKERKAYEKQKKAEEAANKKSLLNFDTLNQLSGPDVEDEKLQAYDDQLEALQDQLEALQDQKDAIDAAAAAADELTYPKAAEAVYDRMKSLVDMLKDAWSDGNFAEIGDRLKNAIINALNSIKWADIKRNATKVGKSLATFLNGLITPSLGDAVGNAFGEYVNTAFSGISGFVDNINAGQIGKTLSNMIVSAVNTIDWELIKRTAQTAGQKLADFFNNAINPDSFGALGTALGNAIQTAIEFAYGFVETIDPINLGKSLAAFVGNAVKSIDWKMAAQTISDAIIKAFQFATTFFEETDWYAVGQAIADFLTNLDWGALLYNAAKAILAGLKAALKVIFKAGLGIELDDDTATWMAEAIGVGILGGAIWKIIKAITGSGGLLSAFGKKDRALEEQTAKTQTEAEAVNVLSGQFAGAGASAMAFIPALNGLTSANNGLIPTVDDLVGRNSELQGSFAASTEGSEVLTSAFNGVSEAAEATAQPFDTATEHSNQTAEAFNGLADTSESSSDRIKTAISDAMETAKSYVSNFANEALNTLGTWKEQVEQTLNNFKQSFAEGITSAMQSAANVVTEWANGVTDYVAKAVNNIAGNANKMLSMIGQAVNSIQNMLSSAVSWVSSTISSVGSTISNWASNAWSSISSIASGWGTASPYNYKPSYEERRAQYNTTPMSGVARIDVSGLTRAVEGMFGASATATGLSLPQLLLQHGFGFARGGVFPANSPIVGVLGDQRRGTNVEAPLDTIKQAVAEVIKKIADTINKSLNRIVDALRTLKPNKTIQSTGTNNELRILLENILASVTEFLSSYFNMFIERIDMLQSSVTAFMQQNIQDMFLEVSRSLVDIAFGGLVDELLAAFTTGFAAATKDIQSRLYSIIGYLGQIHTQIGILILRRTDGYMEKLQLIHETLKQIFTLVDEFKNLFVTKPKNKDDDETELADINDLQRAVYRNLLNIDFESLYTVQDQIREVVFKHIPGLQGTISEAALSVGRAIDWSVNIAAAKVVQSVTSLASGLGSQQLPHLAQGAVIPPNREFMAVLGDQNKGTNIEAPLDTIKQAVAEAIGEGDYGGGNININFSGNLAQLARVLKPEITRERIRSGSSLVIGGNRV